MSTGEITALITAIGGFITVVVGAWVSIRKLTADLQAMKSQLGNSGTHLLDKVNALGEAMERVEQQQAAQGSDIRGIRRDIGRLQDIDREDRERAEAAHRDIWAAIRARMTGKQAP